jgi:hypothetical protein
MGSRNALPLDAPVLEHAFWSGPIEPPPLAETTNTALATGQPRDRHKRINRRPVAAEGSRNWAKAKVVAEGIVDAFLNTVDSLSVYYAEHPGHRAGLVEKIAAVIEQAFSGEAG